MDLDEACRVIVGNPFAVDPRRLAMAQGQVQECAVPNEIRVRRHDPIELELLVLAVGTLQAQSSPEDPGAALAPSTLGRGTASSLPRPRMDYARVVLAAARAQRSLAAISGQSTAIERVRRETWAACFGDSLLHALALRRMIHDHDVLVVGETGTGKEAIAMAIQAAAQGGDDGGPAPSTALNAAAVPPTLIESELFGYVKGAFTGATDTRMGRIRSAHGGTVFLDEVGDLDVTTQVKLLRVIETDEVSPLGSEQTFEADCRYIAATHKDLEAMVERGLFRADLYQRLAGNVIRLPPLRERSEDIPAIGRAFIARHLLPGMLPKTRTRAEEWLDSASPRRYGWPGNVRELQNALRNLLLGLDPAITTKGMRSTEAGPSLPSAIADGVANMKDVQQWYLARVLEATGGNVAEAARRLEVDRTTIRRWTR